MIFKKNLLILIVSIFIYFIINYIYQNVVVSNDYIQIYVLNQDVNRGDAIKEEYFDVVNIKNSNVSLESTIDINTLKEYVFRDSFSKNQILTNDIVLESSLYESSDLEIITIKFDSIENIAAYKVEKGSIVNVFYTAKYSEISNVIEDIDNQKMYVGEGTLETVTIKLFENINILNAYDKDGNIIKISDNTDGEIISTITVEVSKNEALIYNSIKDKGIFSISVIS